jgi:hypothetical protein
VFRRRRRRRRRVVVVVVFVVILIHLVIHLLLLRRSRRNRPDDLVDPLALPDRPASKHPVRNRAQIPPRGDQRPRARRAFALIAARFHPERC